MWTGSIIIQAIRDFCNDNTFRVWANGEWTPLFIVAPFLISNIGYSGQGLGDPAYKWPVVEGEPALLCKVGMVRGLGEPAGLCKSWQLGRGPRWEPA